MRLLFTALICVLVLAGCSKFQVLKKAGQKVTKTVAICTETNAVEKIKTSAYSEFTEQASEQELAAPNMMFSWDTKMVTW